MNGYNVTMRGQRQQDRHNFVRHPNVKLPDTVGKDRHISLGYDRLIISVSRLENSGIRHPRERSRSMRFMLGFLQHWFPRRPNLQGHQQIDLVVRTKLGRLLNCPRQHGMQRWFDGSSFRIHQGQRWY